MSPNGSWFEVCPDCGQHGRFVLHKIILEDKDGLPVELWTKEAATGALIQLLRAGVLLREEYWLLRDQVRLSGMPETSMHLRIALDPFQAKDLPCPTYRARLMSVRYDCYDAALEVSQGRPNPAIPPRRLM